MDEEMARFHHDLYQEVLAHADAVGAFAEDAFFDVATQYLVEAGEIETADRAAYIGARGARVDGYAGDPRDSNGVLTVILLDFQQTEFPETLTATELRAINARARGFVSRALDADFRLGLEEARPAYGLSDMIAAAWPTLVKIRVVLISNRILSSRVDGVPAGDLNGIPITHNVWDLGRLHRYVAVGREREDIEVDLVEDFPAPMFALPAAMGGGDYEGYLVVVPGTQLAAIYDHWGTRLLEQNVRVFLQARGAVNRGIRRTLDTEPHMFFAYNNGIAATAEGVVTQSSVDGLRITRIQNLQIVNGGQTTASIHAALLRKVDLSNIFVQMKLSIISPDKSMDVVPRISEYANSQNRVSQADFFSNHPFHVRMEQFSRRIYAPSVDGAYRESKWFYERARGQYQDARAGLTATRRKEFDLEYPRSQLFAKTDLSKFNLVWEGQPHIVGRGAQRHFAAFAGEIAKKWESDSDFFSEVYYKQSISKAIVWKRLESLVPKQPWYDGGYRANLVAYAIAKLAHDLARHGRRFDFDIVWRTQAVPDPVEEDLVHAAKAILQILQNPQSGRANVTEWAKHVDCWEAVKGMHLSWPRELGEASLNNAEAVSRMKDGAKDQKVLNGIAAQTAAVVAGGIFWQDVLRWGRERRLLAPKEVSILNVCAALPARIPTEAQSIAALAVYERLRGQGLLMPLPSAG